MMTVRQLCEALKQYPDDMLVFSVDGMPITGVNIDMAIIGGLDLKNALFLDITTKVDKQPSERPAPSTRRLPTDTPWPWPFPTRQKP